MGFLSKFFGEKQKGRSVDTTRPDLQFYETLIDNIALSDEFQIELKGVMKKAFQDPKSFFDETGDFTVSDRRLTYPEDINLTPKFVLIDKMIAVGQMAEVDWKEEEEEIRFSVIEIIKTKEYDLLISTDDKYEMATDKILESLNDNEIQPFGYRLEILDINSDSYVFTIVPINKSQLVREMFDKLK